MSSYQVQGRAGQPIAGRFSRQAAARALRAVAVPLALSIGLTGCLSQIPGGGHYVPETVAERHPIKVTRAMARLDVEVDGSRLSEDDRFRVAQFAQEYRSGAGGPMIVARPKGGRDHVAAAAKVASIQKELRGAGVPADAIAYRVYQAGGAHSTPVILTFERFEATSPQCGDWSSSLAVTYANRPYPNFGCATQQNLAAMVANPRDLVEPRAMTAANASRRDVVIEAWQKGEKTQSVRSKDDSGQVSEQSQSGG